MGYLGNQITTVFPTSISVDSATISGNASVGGTSTLTGAVTTGTSLTVANGLTLSDGNMTLASGHGIDFSATADSGASMSSELFEDYEEGGFTPDLQGYSGTATFTDGMYKKIGHMAFVSFGVTLDSTSDGSHFVVTNLPFVGANTLQMGGYINYTDSTKTDRIHVLKTAADQRVQLYEVGGGTLTYNEIRNSASSVNVRITVIYHTN